MVEAGEGGHDHVPAIGVLGAGRSESRRLSFEVSGTSGTGGIPYRTPWQQRTKAVAVDMYN